MKEIEPIPEHPSLDDVIVGLHRSGETVFQAMARAATQPGVDPFDPAMFETIPHGSMPLANDRVAPLPSLDARGVAAILDFELDSADYDASRVLVAEPQLPHEPRVAVQELWPAIEAAGYGVATGQRSVRRYPEPRSALARLAGLNVRLVDRICSGQQKTVAASDAVTILDALGRGDLAHKMEVEQVQPWRTRRGLAYYDMLEYIVALARFARAAGNDVDLTDDERQALDDICWRSAAAQAGDGPDGKVLTAEERLVTADEWFLEAHVREPIPLSRRLLARARAMFKMERTATRARARELRKGTHRNAPMTTSAVYARTHRLRKANALPRRSKPLAYTQPTD